MKTYSVMDGTLLDISHNEAFVLKKKKLSEVHARSRICCSDKTRTAQNLRSNAWKTKQCHRDHKQITRTLTAMIF